ncbi:DUF6233 domain-containing protein [Streptomyces sp. Inha503]|uniref:DUF6233 domain-containing protein n=1 Tax=Streptomyces sp. Inha503 TaxID=3383314 RepID=UPI0039A01020
MGRGAAARRCHGRARLDRDARPRPSGHLHRGHRLLPVPTQRTPSARAPRSSPAAPAGRWSVQHLPAPAGSPWRRVIHHESCWLPTSDPDLTLDQALHELTRPGSEPCTACEARHLPAS